MDVLTRDEIKKAVTEALREDIGSGDATTLATIPADAIARASMNAREVLVVCGLAFAEEAFQQTYDLYYGSSSSRSELKVTPRKQEGELAGKGDSLMEVIGPAQVLLTAERVALNYVQRLSAIATSTRRYVEAIAGTRAKVLDTRKTTPGWRRFEKMAVAAGGGVNHRIGLYDMVLIKDNHLAALAETPPNPIAAAVRRARQLCPKLRVEVEADTLEQVQQAVEAGADIILLDNMSPEQTREAVRLVNGRAQTEASGGINLKTIRAIAETGVDFISVGAITHSSGTVDIGLDFLT